MDILNDIENKLILPKDVVGKEAFLEKKKAEICLLLDSDEIDVIGIQNIWLEINEIKRKTMESRDSNEFIINWWVIYLKFLNDIKDYLLVSLKTKNIANTKPEIKQKSRFSKKIDNFINKEQKSTVDDKEKAEQIKIQETKEEWLTEDEIDKMIEWTKEKMDKLDDISKSLDILKGIAEALIDTNESECIIEKWNDVFIEQAKKTTKQTNKIEHPPRIKEYLKHIEDVFGIVDIERNNYDVLLKKISFRWISKEKLIDTLSILGWFRNDTNRWWYKRMNSILIASIRDRLERINNSKRKIDLNKEETYNLRLTKNNIISIIGKLQEFKKYINSNNNLDELSLDESYNKLKQDTETIVNNMKLEWIKSKQIKIKLNHDIHTYIRFYEKKSNEEINMRKSGWFFTWDIDDLIEKLKNYKI